MDFMEHKMTVDVRLGRGLRAHVNAPEYVCVSGTSAREAVDALLDTHPQLTAFVLDDARRLRPHVNLFINDELVADRTELSDPVAEGDRLHILPAVSGGASVDGEIGLLVGTKKGLIVGCSDFRRMDWQWQPLAFPGWNVDYAVFDEYSGRAWAAVSHMQWGPRLYWSNDGGLSWSETCTPSFDDGERTLESIWAISGSPDGALYAGVMPAAVFVSCDAGDSWSELRTLSGDPTSETWMPGAAGLMFHHISVDPTDPRRIVVGGSATGLYVSEDGGETWAARNAGVRAEHMALLPDGSEPTAGHCVHSMFAHPLQRGRIWQQNHFGQYRSDDDGRSWIDVGEELPGEFGFASAIEPRDPDTAWFVPLDFDQSRMPRGGALTVYRTRDAGDSWDALRSGLPQHDFHQTVYRQALGVDGLDPLGLYLGTSGGELYASSDAGDSWRQIRGHLAAITSVRAWSVAR